MPSLFPSASALSAVFGSATPASAEKKQLPPGRFQVWSVTEDAERKASDLTKAAAKEYEKASHLAQAKAGNIELYSGKYCKCLGQFGAIQIAALGLDADACSQMRYV